MWTSDTLVSRRSCPDFLFFENPQMTAPSSAAWENIWMSVLKNKPIFHIAFEFRVLKLIYVSGLQITMSWQFCFSPHTKVLRNPPHGQNSFIYFKKKKQPKNRSASVVFEGFFFFVNFPPNTMCDVLHLRVSIFSMSQYPDFSCSRHGSSVNQAWLTLYTPALGCWLGLNYTLMLKSLMNRAQTSLGLDFEKQHFSCSVF